MIDQTTREGKIITAAMDLAASPGWGEIAMRDIADAAGMSLSEVLAVYPDKASVVRGFMKAVDAAMLKGAGDIERAQSPRDAVFEVIMSRFDIMAPYKSGLRSIVAHVATSGPDLRLMGRIAATQNAILQAAGIDPEGAGGVVRKVGLATVYAHVFRIWLDDDDSGLARTMAALDRRLRRGERTLGTVEEMARSARRMQAGIVAGVKGAFERMKRRGQDAGDVDDRPATPDGTASANDAPTQAGDAPA